MGYPCHLFGVDRQEPLRDTNEECVMHFAVNSPEVAKQRRWKKMCAVCLAAQQLRMGDDDGHMDTNWDACRGLCTCGGELRDTKKHTHIGVPRLVATVGSVVSVIMTENGNGG